ncbi:MAG: NfeD family protein [Lachnospiraceae bacterium]|nr:NfeD family protein [Lachnospiraceae bacterium]
MVHIWVIIIVALLVVEFATAALTTIWFAGGALAGLILALIGAPIWLQAAAFAALSVVLLVLTRPLAARIRGKTVRTNADRMIGKEAVVIERIDNVRGTGAVRVEGQEWTARSVNPGHIIEENEIVMVRSISGVKLMVGRRIQED